jgi:hypothetical protein
MSNQVWSKERVIAELTECRRLGTSRNTRLNAAARRYFGCLKVALDLVGLPYHKKPPSKHAPTKQSVIDAIRRRHHDGKNLGCTFREDSQLYSAGKRLFGTWKAARKAAGLPCRESDFYTADEVQLRMIELYEKDLPLTFGSHQDFKLQRSAKKHFGGWRKAAKSLGLDGEIRRAWTNQAVIDGIHLRRASGLDLYTTHKEDKALFCAAVSRFGNWSNAMKAAGIEHPVRERWSEARIIERLQQIANANEGRTVSNTDHNLAHAATRRFGSLQKALERAGTMSLTKRWSKEKVIKAIQLRFAEVGSVPLAGLGDSKLSSVAWKQFGSWAEAVKAAGLADQIPVRTPPKRLSREDVLTKIRQGYASGVSIPELANQEIGLVNAARLHFGQWRRAVEASGLEPTRRIWSRETIIAEIKQRRAEGRSLGSGDRANINLVAAAVRHFGSWTAALKAARVLTKSNK